MCISFNLDAPVGELPVRSRPRQYVERPTGIQRYADTGRSGRYDAATNILLSVFKEHKILFEQLYLYEYFLVDIDVLNRNSKSFSVNRD